MRKLIFSFLLLLWFDETKAQSQWLSVPLSFYWGNPDVFFTDTVADRMYIAGTFSKVNGSNCNILQYDGTSFTMLPFLDGFYTISDMTRYQDKLYVASGYGVAYWDGQVWVKIEEDAGISCFYHYQGKLLMGGRFNKIAGLNIGTIASWDGNNFASFFSVDTLIKVPWTVGTIAEYQNQIYIGGNWDYPNGLKEIARFDGQKWTTVGNGIQGGGLDGVSEIAVWNGSLYIAGLFNEAIGGPGNGIARWDGLQWHRLGNGVTNNEAVYDILFNENVLYAGGPFFYKPGSNSPLNPFARWDGEKWCVMGLFDNIVTAMGVYHNDFFIGGGFNRINGDTNFKKIAIWKGGIDSCLPVVNAVHEIETEGIVKVYPNPVTDFLYLGNNETGSFNIRITDITGKIVLEQTHQSKQIAIDMRPFPQGMYFYSIETKQGKTMKGKILKE